MRLSPPRFAAGWVLAIAAFLTAMALTALPAVAQQTPARTTTVDPETLPIPEGSAAPTSLSGEGGGTMLRLGIGLIVVMGLIAAVWYVLKRIQRSRYPALDEKGGAGTGGLIDVVTTTSLGPNRSLHLVRVGDELVLIGSTDHGVTSLAHLGVTESARVVDAAMPGRSGATASTPSGGRRMDDHARSAAPPDGSLVERLRALTTRR